MNTPTPTRESIAILIMQSLVSSPSYSERVRDIAEDDEFEALAHNTALDAITLADALISALAPEPAN
jgi:hypothetical protein